jgi:hypothetical protein
VFERVSQGDATVALERTLYQRRQKSTPAGDLPLCALAVFVKARADGLVGRHTEVELFWRLLFSFVV